MIQEWQNQLKAATNSVRDLPFAWATDSLPVEERFRTLVPEYYLGLIDPNDPNDPIARMALPVAQELLGDGLRDPIGDLAKKAAPRLTHRYPDRALLHVTNLCPMYCRFCFRKNLMNEKEEGMYAGDFSAAFTYLAAHPEIEEVICTGGDPWMLGDEKLASLVNNLSEASPSLKRLRFHTRMPVTLPSRITSDLLIAISRPEKFHTYVVTHFNHPREITSLAADGIRRMQKAGITVLNQCVLLRGVNDSALILRNLFMGLGNLGVLPYYLHHCDLVSGGEHFRLSVREGQKIWADLRGTLPGYLIPEYVLDIPGGHGKIPLVGEFIKEVSPGNYEIRKGYLKIFYRDPVTATSFLSSIAHENFI